MGGGRITKYIELVRNGIAKLSHQRHCNRNAYKRLIETGIVDSTSDRRAVDPGFTSSECRIDHDRLSFDLHFASHLIATLDHASAYGKPTADLHGSTYTSNRGYMISDQPPFDPAGARFNIRVWSHRFTVDPRSPTRRNLSSPSRP